MQGQTTLMALDDSGQVNWGSCTWWYEPYCPPYFFPQPGRYDQTITLLFPGRPFLHNQEPTTHGSEQPVQLLWEASHHQGADILPQAVGNRQEE